MSKTAVILAAAVLSVTTLVLFGATRNAAKLETQPRNNTLKLITKAGDFKSPMKIKTIRAKGKDIKSNEEFDDDDDWLRGLEIKLANGSGKTVTFYKIQLLFRSAEPSASHPDAVWFLNSGNNPFHYATDMAIPPQGSKPIRPGDFLTVELNELERSDLNAFVKSVTGSLPSKLEIRVILLGFSDGTAWSGQMARRDAKRGWVPANASTAKARLAKQKQIAQQRGVKFSHATAQFGDNCGFIFPSVLQCPPQPSECKWDRMNLFDELSGNDSVSPAATQCKFILGGNTLNCMSVLSQAAASCPCGQQWDTCLMNSDCCSGFCNGGECGPPCPLNCGVCIDGLCYDESPVLVDTLGNGFALTDLGNGVNFDLNSDGTAEHLSWTTAASDDAWLVLDRNGNGTIDNGVELFGNFTPQADPPPGVIKNGFAALAEFDKTENGGNADGLITNSDHVFSALKLWQDTNHNGVSETSEVHSLRDFGLTSIDCRYKTSKRTDQFGNRFSYRAKVHDARNTQVGRWAWDVFLLTDR